MACSQLPVGAVQDVPALLAVGKQLQDESRGVELIERVLVDEALDAPDCGLRLCVAADVFCELGVADIFGLEERADHQDQEVSLVLAVLGEERDEVQSEGVEDGVGRVPSCHDLARIVTPRKTVGYCSLERLVLVISTATLFLVSEGLQVVEQGLRRVVDPHWQRGLSYLKIGLRAMQYALARGQTVFIHLGLHGGVDSEPVGDRTSKKSDPQIAFEVGWRLVFRLAS